MLSCVLHFIASNRAQLQRFFKHVEGSMCLPVPPLSPLVKKGAICAAVVLTGFKCQMLKIDEHVKLYFQGRFKKEQ